MSIEGISSRRDYYQLKVADLKSRNNASRSRCRAIFRVSGKALTNASLPENRRRFAASNHSPVIHSIKKVEEMRRTDGDFNTLINNSSKRSVEPPAVLHTPPQGGVCVIRQVPGGGGIHSPRTIIPPARLPLHRVSCCFKPTNGEEFRFNSTFFCYNLCLFS